MILDGDFTPAQLEVIISRAGMETPKDEAAVEPSPAAEEATPEEVKQVKEHPEAAWVESPRPKRKPEPDLPQNSIEPFDTTGLTTNVGGINSIVDPDRGKAWFSIRNAEGGITAWTTT
jgi:hypothetical protein